MQDRPNIDVDPTLVDRGWAQMSRQLDEVMPVRKRRILPWFWLLLFVVVGSSAGVYQYFQQKDGSANESIHPATIQDIILPETTQVQAPIADSKELDTNREGRIFKSENINETTSQEKNTTNASIVQTINSEVIEPIFANEISSQSLQVSGIDDETKNNAVKEDNLSLRNNEEISLLDKQNIALLDIQKPVIEQAITYKSLKSTHLFAMTEMEMGLGNYNPQGGAIGVGFQYPLSNKFSIELGANFQTVSTNLISNVLGIDKNTDASFSPVTSIYGSATYQVNQAYDRLEIQKFNFPLQVRLKIDKRWHVTAGVQTTYYTKAFVKFDDFDETSIPIGLEIGDATSFDLYDQSVPVYRFDSSTNVASLPYDLNPNRWQWSGVLGAQYRLSNRIGLDAKYRRNISQWPDDKEAYGAKSYLSLGLRFYVW